MAHPNSKLKYLLFPCCNIYDRELSIICDALLGNCTLKRLNLGGNYINTSVGWGALSTVLRHPNCKLVDLDVNNNGINDETAEVLGSALRGSLVMALNLSSSNSITSRGWHMFLNHLAQTSIQKMNLSDNSFDDQSLATLASIGTLKSLNLSWNHSITPTDWRSFFNTLHMRGTQLVKLNISGNNIGNEAVATLGRLLSNMSSLKTLVMDCMDGNQAAMGRGGTSQFWVSLFTSLQDSNLNMVNLSFNYAW